MLQKWPLFPPGLEPGTFRVLGERDNHYTTETATLSSRVALEQVALLRFNCCFFHKILLTVSLIIPAGRPPGRSNLSLSDRPIDSPREQMPLSAQA